MPDLSRRRAGRMRARAEHRAGRAPKSEASPASAEGGTRRAFARRGPGAAAGVLVGCGPGARAEVLPVTMRVGDGGTRAAHRPLSRPRSRGRRKRSAAGNVDAALARPRSRDLRHRSRRRGLPPRAHAAEINDATRKALTNIPLSRPRSRGRRKRSAAGNVDAALARPRRRAVRTGRSRPEPSGQVAGRGLALPRMRPPGRARGARENA